MEKRFIKNIHGLDIVVAVDEKAEAKGLVFIMHGLGGFKEQPSIQVMQQVFSSAGLTTVLFDTTHSFGESGGKYENATMESYYSDLKSVIAWAALQPWYFDTFFLAGHSLGGYSVLRFAEEDPEVVKGVFAWAPVVSGQLSHEAHQRFSSEELKKWKIDGWQVKVSRSIPGVEKHLPWSHMTERLNHDLLLKADKLTMPIFILVGERDESCPPDHQKIMFDKIPSLEKKLVVIENAPHSFYEEEYLAKLKIELSQWVGQFK